MDEFLEELDKQIFRHGGDWAAFIVRALWPHPKGLSRKEVLDAVLEDALERGRNVPRTFKDVIQSTLHRHNAASDVFRADPSQDIFRFAGPKGAGMWVLNKGNALAWMAKNGRSVDFALSTKSHT